MLWLLTQLAAFIIFLEIKSKLAIVSSLTALAFAPGVLKTAIFFLVHYSKGILLTPVPALKIAFRFSFNLNLCKSNERKTIASGFFISFEQ